MQVQITLSKLSAHACGTDQLTALEDFYVSPPIVDINSLTMQEIKNDMESDSNYSTIFTETFKLMNILLTLPLGTASVERSFSQIKMIKTRLRNCLTDVTLAKLMRIATEGPEQTKLG